MKTLKELIPLVIQWVKEENFTYGLCLSIHDMTLNGRISMDEEYILRAAIREYGKYKGLYKQGSAWWGIHKKQPRIEFLKELLKLQE